MHREIKKESISCTKTQTGLKRKAGKKESEKRTLKQHHIYKQIKMNETLRKPKSNSFPKPKDKGYTMHMLVYS